MTYVATADVHDVANSRSSAAPLVHPSRVGDRPRTMRILIQVACLGVVTLAVRAQLPVMEVLVVALLVTGAVAFMAYSASRSRPAAAARTVRVWGLGAVVSLIAVPVVGALGGDPPVGQLGALALLAVLSGLARMRDSWRTAGSQLDAILATLPPPATDAAVSPVRGGSSSRPATA